MDVYLSIGSDLGDRAANLKKALSLLERRLGVAPSKVSRIIETPAMGFEGPDFLNLAVLFEIPVIEPETLLDICQSVENDCGRPPHKAEFDSKGNRIYRPRTIDIDILYIGDLIINTPRLTVPHPGISDRPFVKIPLFEILSGKSVFGKE